MSLAKPWGKSRAVFNSISAILLDKKVKQSTNDLIKLVPQPVLMKSLAAPESHPSGWSLGLMFDP